MAADLSTLTVSLCVTQFHCLSYSLMVGSLFFMVLQILSGFFPKLTVFKKKTQKNKRNTSSTFHCCWYWGTKAVFHIYSRFLSPQKFFCFFFFNWDSPHARLDSHYKAWSCKKKSTKKITGYRKSA